MKHIYAGIGSRETPPDVLKLMFTIGYRLAEGGWTLRSGHASGADQAFEKGARQAGGLAEIFLPWQGFEGAHSSPRNVPGIRQRYIVPETEYAELWQDCAVPAAKHFHPAWGHCTEGAKKLHTRNMFQVAGCTLDDLVDMVVCWTRGGRREGGTGQALRAAKYFGVPIFDLGSPGFDLQTILDFVNGEET